MNENIFEIELKTLEENIVKLRNENPTGGYVVIKGTDILGVWGSRIDALKEGEKKYGNVPFLVKDISEVHKVVNMSRNIFA